MPKVNRTSSIRSGLDYQDYWGMRICADWLDKSDHYKWIQFETSPDYEDSSQFSLDDIVCLGQDDRFQLFQIKYRQDSESQWTWNDLLKPKKSGGTSSIKKWAKSLLPRVSRTGQAFFVTNGQASHEISRYLSGEIVNVDQIREQDQNLYTRFQSEIGSAPEISQFFQLLRFRFSQKGIEELDDETRNTLRVKLYVTKSGADNLILKIHEECRKQHTGQLTLPIIRNWCEFDIPRHLNEEFQIPQDFEFFNNQTHQEIVADLKTPQGGIKVIVGKPGVGKSVYLSKLDKELKNSGIISIKHHYHISPEDSSPLERLNAERVVEAVKFQFKARDAELGQLANANSKDIPLSKFIHAIASHSNTQGKGFVIIVDGLDHVLRYKSKDELESFLREVCLPQPGLWIVFGMQSIAKPHLPQIVLDKCPETSWIEIKGLDKASVSQIIQTNAISLKLPDEHERFLSVIEKLFTVTRGNPLHLRYTLKQLKTRLNNSLITEYECEDLIPYGDSIEQYYTALWGQIPEKAKTLLLTISCVNFHFTDQQLVACCAPAFQEDPSEVTKSFNAISHLVSRNYRGQISVYHNSFELFLKHTDEARLQKTLLRTNIRTWLRETSYEDLKWAELRILEHDLGNSTPILELDRGWLIDAICHPRNSDQISNQMRMAAAVAFEKKDFAKALHISYLHTYFLNAGQFLEEAVEVVWREALHLNGTSLDHINFKLLPTPVLAIAAKLADSRGDLTAIEEIYHQLDERLAQQEYRSKTVPPVTGALLDVIPYNREHKLNRVHRYILQFRDLGITDALFKIYAHKLLSLHQLEKVKALLACDLSPIEERTILEVCAKHGIEHPAENLSSLKGRHPVPVLWSLYSYLKGVGNGSLPTLPPYQHFPPKIVEHDFDERMRWKEFYYDHFLVGVLYALSGKEVDVQRWIDDAPVYWSAKAMCSLFACSLKIGTAIKHETISYDLLFTQSSGLKALTWLDDRECIGFQTAFNQALQLIFPIVIAFNSYVGSDNTIQLGNYETIRQCSPFYTLSDLLNLAVNIDKPIFADDAYETMMTDEVNRLANTVDEFQRRAKDYANLSKLARLHKQSDQSAKFLRKAADNLLGHGYHKDVYLYHVIDAIELCAKAGVDKGTINGWVERITPIIENVGAFTDGDETNNLPFRLAGFFGKQMPGLLYKAYYEAAEKEELYHAEKLFKHLIDSLSFLTKQQISLASTALDKDSFLALQTIAESNINARTALDIIESYLGVISFQDERHQPSTSMTDRPQDYTQVPPSNLLDHLLGSTFQNKWESNEYLVGWINHWEDKIDKAELCNVFSKVVERCGIDKIRGEPLDILAPLTYEFDAEKSFAYVCAAQNNDHGWQPYWSDRNKARQRWLFIKEKFPDRFNEFFHKSTEGHVPLPHGVEFLLFFEDAKNAELITEASVQFANLLMADLKLTLPEWFTNTHEIDEVDILIQRLLWPSPLVRERSATALAVLLNDPTNKEAVYRKLLVWIGQQQMESAVAIGLLPLIKALCLCTNPDDLSYVDIQSVAAQIQINSIVTEQLIEELYLLVPPTQHAALPPYKSIVAVPPTYMPSPFFTKYVQTFLAPIYLENAESIEGKCWKQFVKQWAFTFDALISETGVCLDVNQAYFYARSQHDDVLHGFSSKISEVFRSSFLRVLQHFYGAGDVQQDWFLGYAYASLPIELSKWKMLPQRCPEWWPQLVASSAAEDASISSISFKSPPEDLIKINQGKVLLAAEGSIRPANGWAVPELLHSILLIGFGYKVVGSDLPSAEEIAANLSFKPLLIRIPSLTNRPFHFLEDETKYLSTQDGLIKIRDIYICPLVAREVDLCIGLWQFFRDMHMPMNLNVPFSTNLTRLPNEKGWTCHDAKGKTIAGYADWLEGLRERGDYNQPIPYGQYIMADKNFVDEFLVPQGLRLGYFLKSTYLSRKSRYDKLVKYEDAKLLNVSSIISAPPTHLE